jgi:dTDP-4-dehydrorhamnose 3,5-epimerase-like enzyme
MEIIKTGIKGLIEIIPSAYHNKRGWFLEFYKEPLFQSHNMTYQFPQVKGQVLETFQKLLRKSVISQA